MNLLKLKLPRNGFYKNIGVFSMVLMMLSVTSCKQKRQSQIPNIYPVMTVSSSDLTLEESYSASIKGQLDISVYPQVSGFITKVCVTEGQKVKKGQSLFIIDQTSYKAALKTAMANVSAARASVSTAELSYKSSKVLFSKKVVSSFDLKTSENNFKKAKASLEQALAQKINAQNNLMYSEVKSAADGVVGSLPYKVGALVGPSIPSPLTTVSDNNNMSVYFSMTETEILNIVRKYGSTDKALETMPAIGLKLIDGSIYKEKGKIVSISGVIDNNTGTVSIKSIFPNPDGILRSGATGSVLLPYEYKNSVIIPQTAVFELQNKSFIYRLVEGKAQAGIVVLQALNNGQEYIVKSGLKAGEVIISDGVSMLRDGMAIQPKEDIPVDSKTSTKTNK